MGSSDATLGLWSEAVDKLLNNTTLYEQCSVAAKNYAEYYDVDQVTEIWKRELLGVVGRLISIDGPVVSTTFNVKCGIRYCE